MIKTLKSKGFSGEELARFRDFQRRSYDTLVTVAGGLKEGVTEKEVARRARKAFHEQGVHVYFHVPVALFGDRTTYPGDFGKLGALATDRALRAGDPVILDAAPIYEGFSVDTSYAFTFGENKAFSSLDAKLVTLRGMILDLVKRRVSLRKIAFAVDDYIVEHGMQNCHKKHIAAVLGHRLMMAPDWPLGQVKLWGLGPREVAWFFFKTFIADLHFKTETPNWNHSAVCECPPQPGLWAVEPHLARDGVGAKFEEILVITEDDAYWLDDDLPHTRRWRAAA